MNAGKFLIILISIIGILYIPFRMQVLKNHLVEINGILEEVEKSGTRKPYYRFKLGNYPNNIFYNSGNGFLKFVRIFEQFAILVTARNL